MTAYIVAIKLCTTDQTELDRYQATAMEAVTPDQKILAAYGNHRVLEGTDHQGMVILEFPDADAAMEWYNSDAYRAARSHRWKGADYQLTLIEGR